MEKQIEDDCICFNNYRKRKGRISCRALFVGEALGAWQRLSLLCWWPRDAGPGSAAVAGGTRWQEGGDMAVSLLSWGSLALRALVRRVTSSGHDLQCAWASKEQLEALAVWSVCCPKAGFS